MNNSHVGTSLIFMIDELLELEPESCCCFTFPIPSQVLMYWMWHPLLPNRFPHLSV